METATSLVIGQLSGYLQGLTRRLDPGAGWYGEFLRRDPDGMRACLDGAAIPPWDVVESLLRDLEVARGAEFAARETVYAARLRAAAVTAWDRLPGGAEELRTLLAAAGAQRAHAQAALRSLSGRLGAAADRAEADALARELSWTRDDAARAAARYADLAARLEALPGHRPASAVPPAGPLPGPASPDSAVPPAGSPSGPPVGPYGGSAVGPSSGPVPGCPAGSGGSAAEPASASAAGAPPGPYGGSAAGFASESVAGPASAAAAGAYGVETAGEVEPPVGRAEGRWPRGARRAGGARYAGGAAVGPPAFTPPPGQPADDGATTAGPDGGPVRLPSPRGARFGRAEPESRFDALPPPRGARRPGPTSGPDVPRGARVPRRGPTAGSPRSGHPEGGGHDPRAEPPGASQPPPPGADAPARRAFVGELLALRAQGRTGEAHALLCEAAAWPAELLPELAADLNRAGLAADWATLLWEAASLPPEGLAAAAAALGAAGRRADCDRLLRQGVARPGAEVAEVALALGAAGRDREAEALLGAFVGLRTAEEAAALARRDPHWFAPRLLRAARALSGTRHRDLAHALRVAGIPAA